MNRKHKRRPGANGATKRTSKATGSATNSTQQWHLGPDHEPSGWLREQARNAIDRGNKNPLMRVGSVGGVHVMLLCGPPPGSGTREDRTCDRCRTYVLPGPVFYLLTYAPEPRYRLLAGLCRACIRREGVQL